MNVNNEEVIEDIKTDSIILIELSKEELIGMIKDLKKKLESKGKGRKDEVLRLLTDGYNSITSIAEELGINNKNVSSQLTYLRKEGYKIISYSLDGKRILEMRE